MSLSTITMTSLMTPALAAKKATTTKAKVKPTTTKKKRVTTKVASVPTTTISKLSQAKVDAVVAYGEYVKVYLAGFRTPEDAPKLYPPIMTGEELVIKLKEASNYVSEGGWWDLTWETFDLRVDGATQTSAQLSACIRIIGPRKRRSDNTVYSVAGDINPYISEKQWQFVKAGSKWKVSAEYHLEDQEGASKCADGR
jgi:hypothetical protein